MLVVFDNDAVVVGADTMYYVVSAGEEWESEDLFSVFPEQLYKVDVVKLENVTSMMDKMEKVNKVIDNVQSDINYYSSSSHTIYRTLH